MEQNFIYIKNMERNNLICDKNRTIIKHDKIKSKVYKNKKKQVKY
jgi:hypothetical protein